MTTAWPSDGYGDAMFENVTLNGRQRAAIVALLTTGDATEAASAAGVSRQTLYRWMQQAAFKSALREAESEAMRGLARRLAGLGGSAADALRDALDPLQTITVRLRAADLVTSRGPALTELTDLLTRIEALEARL